MHEVNYFVKLPKQKFSQPPDSLARFLDQFLFCFIAGIAQLPFIFSKFLDMHVQYVHSWAQLTNNLASADR